MKKQNIPKKPWKIAGACGGLYLLVGMVMLLTPQKDVAWTMAIGGTILLCVGIAMQQLAEILHRLDVLEKSLADEASAEEK